MVKRARGVSMRARWFGGLTAAGAMLALPESRVCALEPEPYFNVGTYGSYTFGAQQPWGMGIDLRLGSTGGPYDRDCTGEPKTFYFAGGAVRFEWFPASHSRLLLVAQGGYGAALVGAQGEAGIGYRFGGSQRLETVIGGELDYAMGLLALRLDPLRGELTPALGLLFPSVVIPSAFFEGCAVAGRPQRAGHGFAPLPTITTQDVSSRPCHRAPPEATKHWGQRAQTELASVSAFVELAQQLHAVGAPKSLIDRCHEAARDELRHALLAADHCARLGDQRVELHRDCGNMRPPLVGPHGMLRLAAESWVDGCLGEGLAAHAAALEAALTCHADVKTSQRAIAHDEAEHAELAWDVLAWALRAGGCEVRDALHAVADAAPTHPGLRHAHERLETFGILDNDRLHALSIAHREQSLQRLHQLLVAG